MTHVDFLLVGNKKLKVCYVSFVYDIYLVFVWLPFLSDKN